MHPNHLIAIVGATACGKTDVGEDVAQAVEGEIVCADSRQVFRELDIGTGKPTLQERSTRPHHLFDALALTERASAGWYASAAQKVCGAIWERGRTPVLVGGSGLYLRAARDGLASVPSSDPDVRARIAREMAVQGPEAMHARLGEADPETAARLEPRDRQRIARALEVLDATGQPLSWWHRRERTPPMSAVWHVFEIQRHPDGLRERIARRTAWMLDHGLVEEVRELLDSPSAEALRKLGAIGYDEAIALIEGRATRAKAETLINQRTAQLAKRQRTWFRHQMERRVVDGSNASVAAQGIAEAYRDVRA